MCTATIGASALSFIVVLGADTAGCRGAKRPRKAGAFYSSFLLNWRRASVNQLLYNRVDWVVCGTCGSTTCERCSRVGGLGPWVSQAAGRVGAAYSVEFLGA